MERKEDTDLVESPEDTTDRGATSLMSLASDVEKCALSTTADDTISTDEDPSCETKSESEETENFEIESEKLVESCDAERVSSYFNVKYEYSHVCCYSLQLDHALLRRIRILDCPNPNSSPSCRAKTLIQVLLWKDPKNDVELVKCFFTLTHPFKKRILVDFVMEVYDAEGLYFRNYESSTVFTEENFMHECLNIRLAELGESDNYPKLKLYWAVMGCCNSNLSNNA